MTEAVVALPMYDWPEAAAETDAEWRRLRAALAASGVAAPARLARSNADLPPVPGRPALPPHGFDFQALWRHPALLFAQTCWGPMEEGLAAAVQLVGQPSYDAFQGGMGPLYASAVVMRGKGHAGPREDGQANLPLDLMRGKRFAYNSLDSMSGILAPSRDLGGIGLFAERVETGGHRASIVAVAEGRADVAAIDCRSWDLALRFEPAAAELAVVGWTARRPGLPYITGRATPAGTVARMRRALASA